MNDQLIEDVCKKLGIKTQNGNGSMYLEENGVNKKLLDADFEAMFGFMKKDVEIILEETFSCKQGIETETEISDVCVYEDVNYFPYAS
jgi:hypothetical protein